MPRPKDETYIVDLCDKLLERRARRGHRFEFLRGDQGRRRKRLRLPVDAYYRDLKLVVEYHERQRFEAVPFFDRMIVSSGITRGGQRRKYDQLRRDVLPMHSITLIEISYQEFEHDGRKRLLRVPSDLPVLQKRLSGVATADIPPQLA